MKPLSLQTVRRVVAKSVPGAGKTQPQIRTICLDSRKMTAGSLFVAIPGDVHDGHAYVAEAAQAGAVAALVERTVQGATAQMPLLQVDSTRAALGKLARHVRQQMRAKVVAVAGSNGKTSTKHLIHATLAGKLYGSMSPKSFNNDIGVPWTIFDADPQQDYLVLEMGTNHPGEISSLTGIGLPDIAVITNCSAEHLEFLGDLAGVRSENAAIIQGLNPKGLLVVNGDNPDLLDAVAGYKGDRVTFGFKEHNDVFAADVRADGRGVRFSLNGGRQQCFVPLLGRHTACNALAAIAVARRLGLKEAEIEENLAVAEGPEMRLQLRQIGGVSVLNDAYNANPASMRAALDTLGTLPSAGRRIAVLGDMRELGRSSERYHREVGQLAAAARLDALACVGQHAKILAASAAGNGMADGAIHCFDDSSSASQVVPRWLKDGDLVLLKASRGIHLERVAQEITTVHGTGAVTPS